MDGLPQYVGTRAGTQAHEPSFRDVRHFQSLLFSGSHTYMNSPSNRITLVQDDDTDVDHLDLRFPECAGRSGTYYRRVVKFRIPINKMTFYWNGPGANKPDIVVKVDGADVVKYLVKDGDDLEFENVSHPEFPDADQSFLVKAYLKDSSFIESGVFVLGESTTPRDIPLILEQAKELGGKVVLVGSGGPGNIEALHALCNVNLDPRKYFDYWHQIHLDREERRKKYEAEGVILEQLPALEPDVEPPVLSLSLLQRAQTKLRNSKSARAWFDSPSPSLDSGEENVDDKETPRNKSPSEYLTTRTKTRRTRRSRRKNKENKLGENGEVFQKVHAIETQKVQKIENQKVQTVETQKVATPPIKPATSRLVPALPQSFQTPQNKISAPKPDSQKPQTPQPLKSSLKKPSPDPDSPGSSSGSSHKKTVTWSKKATAYTEVRTELQCGQDEIEFFKENVQINGSEEYVARKNIEMRQKFSGPPRRRRRSSTPIQELPELASEAQFPSLSPSVQDENESNNNKSTNKVVKTPSPPKETVKKEAKVAEVKTASPKEKPKVTVPAMDTKSTLSFAQIAKQAPPVMRTGPSTLFSPTPFSMVQSAPYQSPTPTTTTLPRRTSYGQNAYQSSNGNGYPAGQNDPRRSVSYGYANGQNGHQHPKGYGQINNENANGNGQYRNNGGQENGNFYRGGQKRVFARSRGTRA